MLFMFLHTLGALVLAIERIHGALVLELGVHALVGAGGSRELVVKRSHATLLVSLPLLTSLASLSLASLSLASLALALASLASLALSAASLASLTLSASSATILRMRSTSQHLGLGDRRDLASRLGLNHGGVIQHLTDGIEGGHSTSLASLLLKQLTIQRIGRAGSTSLLLSLASLASLTLSVLLALSVSATLPSVLAALLISATYGHF